TAVYATAATESSAVGSYDITATLLDPDAKLGNYSVTNTKGTLTVTLASLMVKVSDVSREYGASNPALSGVITGVRNGDVITAVYATVATESSAVGSYDITATLLDPDAKLGNYSVTNTKGTLTVTKARLSVTPIDMFRWAGFPNPAFSGTVTGLKGADATTVTYSTYAHADSPPGKYPITAVLSDPDHRLGNYDAVLQSGTLAVYEPPKITFAGGDQDDGVTADLTLPQQDASGTGISWTSTDNNIIDAATGRVSRPSFDEGDAQVVIKATVQANGTEYYKQYPLVVKATALSDSDAVERDKAALAVGFTPGDQADHITQPVVLPSAGEWGSGIVWTSSHPAVINPRTGHIQRPGSVQSDIDVLLTATIVKGAATAEKNFNLKVIRSAAVPSGLMFTEAGYSLLIGQTQSTVVSITYSDGATYRLSEGVRFASEQPMIAQIDSQGMIQGLSAGQTVISAVYNNLTARATVLVSNPVNPGNPDNPILSALTFSEPLYTIQIGQSMNTVLTAVYGNETRVIISSQAAYRILDSAYARVDAKGQLTGLLPGQTVVSATYGGLTAQAMVIVTDPDPDRSGSSSGGAASPDNAEPQAGTDFRMTLLTSDGVLKEIEASVSRIEEGIVTINTGSEGGSFLLPGDVLKQIRTIRPDSLLVFQTKSMSFKIPLSELNLQEAAAAASLSGDGLHFEIVMDRSAAPSGSRLTDAERLSDYVRFEVRISDGAGKTASIPAFRQYVERTVSLGVNHIPVTATAVWWDEAKSEYRFVPAAFDTKDGETAAVMKRQGTSLYTVLNRPVSFNDMRSHWAQNEVSLLASKLVIQGRSADSFDPDGSITRAEAAALLVRALGLNGAQGASVFADTAGGWYEPDVITATQAGLIQGYADGTFRPDGNITREELAVMLIRAVRYTGFTKGKSAQTANLPDAGQISAWARAAVDEAVGLGMIQGDEQGAFHPRQFVSRAESTAMLYRMLQQLAFI
uniref:immunoglobulin-like domain-containing protein n=1 Tax=Paenibacillus allorhizosphaerae TaxID=2849866 RepID=UPI001C4068BE